MITSEQRERRKLGIFASDAARIMTGNGVQVFLEKLGQAQLENLDDEPSVQLGNVLEAPVLDAYERERPALNLIRSPDTMLHPELQWLGCHLDGHAIHSDHTRVVESKAYSVFNRGEWGDVGSDEVPSTILWQTMAQMAISSAAHADVPVCFVNEAALVQFLTQGTVPIEIFTIPRSDELIAYMIEECGKVWDCVQNQRLPEPVKVGDARLIYKRDSGEVVEASDKIAQAHALLMAIRQSIKADEAKEEVLKEQMQAYMRDASELRYKGKPLATWKQAQPSHKFDEGAFAKAHPDLFVQFVVEKPGSRRFLPKSV